MTDAAIDKRDLHTTLIQQGQQQLADMAEGKATPESVREVLESFAPQGITLEDFGISDATWPEMVRQYRRAVGQDSVRKMRSIGTFARYVRAHLQELGVTLEEAGTTEQELAERELTDPPPPAVA